MASLLRARTPLARTVFTRANYTSFSVSRQFSTETTGGSAPRSKAGLYAGVAGAIVIAAGAYYAFSPDKAANAAKSVVQSAKAVTHFTPSKEDYQKVYNKIASKLDADNYDDGSYGPVLVRLAWHSSGTYDKDSGSGGSNCATMRFEPESLHGANNGLHVARTLMEEVKKEFPWLSYGDLWTLAGVCAVQEMQGPKVPWRPGRIDGTEKDVPPDGRLPDAAQSQDHLRNVFYRMGFNDQEIVALAGAHALGRCHRDRSGFEGPWTFSPITFTNDFFKLLLDEKWIWRKWDGPKQLQDKKSRTLMMLPTDYSLIQDKTFKQYVKKYAESEEVFFQDFSKSFGKLLELGVPSSQWVTSQPWEMKTLEEQQS